MIEHTDAVFGAAVVANFVERAIIVAVAAWHPRLQVRRRIDAAGVNHEITCSACCVPLLSWLQRSGFISGPSRSSSLNTDADRRSFR